VPRCARDQSGCRKVLHGAEREEFAYLSHDAWRNYATASAPLRLRRPAETGEIAAVIVDGDAISPRAPASRPSANAAAKPLPRGRRPRPARRFHTSSIARANVRTASRSVACFRTLWNVAVPCAAREAHSAPDGGPESSAFTASKPRSSPWHSPCSSVPSCRQLVPRRSRRRASVRRS